MYFVLHPEACYFFSMTTIYCSDRTFCSCDNIRNSSTKSLRLFKCSNKAERWQKKTQQNSLDFSFAFHFKNSFDENWIFLLKSIPKKCFNLKSCRVTHTTVMVTESTFPNSGAKVLQTDYQRLLTDFKEKSRFNFNACGGAIWCCKTGNDWCSCVVFTWILVEFPELWNLFEINTFIFLSL